ncbi:hypothetical protein V8B97DRAFT_1520543 [Scleroderma yunnanense]
MPEPLCRVSAQHSAELKQELREHSKTALSVLVSFLAFQSVSSSNALQAVTLAFLLYTVSLHVITCTGLIQRTPFTLCVVLHAIPFAGVFAMATAELVLAVGSPAIAVAALVLCSLFPLGVIILHMWWIQYRSANLPAHVKGGEPVSCCTEVTVTQ